MCTHMHAHSHEHTCMCMCAHVHTHRGGVSSGLRLLAVAIWVSRCEHLPLPWFHLLSQLSKATLILLYKQSRLRGICSKTGWTVTHGSIQSPLKPLLSMLGMQQRPSDRRPNWKEVSPEPRAAAPLSTAKLQDFPVA